MRKQKQKPKTSTTKTVKKQNDQLVDIEYFFSVDWDDCMPKIQVAHSVNDMRVSFWFRLRLQPMQNCTIDKIYLCVLTHFNW